MMLNNRNRKTWNNDYFYIYEDIKFEGSLSLFESSSSSSSIDSSSSSSESSSSSIDSSSSSSSSSD